MAHTMWATERTGGLPTVVTFEPWDEAPGEPAGADVDGPYGRAAWRPVLGYGPWQVWAAIAARLRLSEAQAWPLEELVPPGYGAADVVMRCLDRLETFHLAYGRRRDVWVVRTSCPPLAGRFLSRAPSPVHAIHVSTFRATR